MWFSRGRGRGRALPCRVGRRLEQGFCWAGRLLPGVSSASGDSVMGSSVSGLLRGRVRGAGGVFNAVAVWFLGIGGCSCKVKALRGSGGGKELLRLKLRQSVCGVLSDL